jgi:hypothetical protein
MNTRFKSRTHLRRVSSMHELELEKARLKMELVRVEEKIHYNYKNLAEQFTLKNLLSRVVEELAMTSVAVSKAVTIGKDLFSAFKKKKKKWKERREGIQPVENPEMDIVPDSEQRTANSEQRTANSE